jgi:hypothetical protein
MNRTQFILQALAGTEHLWKHALRLLSVFLPDSGVLSNYISLSQGGAAAGADEVGSSS